MNENMLHYKGYTAKVTFSDTDGCLIGKVMGIDDSVTFEGESVREMRKAFRIALDDYISYCEKIGKNPDRPYSGKLMVRLTPERHRAVAFAAEASGQSINDVIATAIDAIVTSPTEQESGKKSKSKSKRTAQRKRPLRTAARLS